MHTKEDLIQSFSYKDGCIFHKIRKQSIKVNSRAGTLRSDGYRIVRFAGASHYEHRIIFCMFHGCTPNIIDHINGLRADNRIENLREATVSLNLINTDYCKPGKKLRGVYYIKSSNNWRCEIQSNGDREYLGTHSDFFEACCARKSREAVFRI